MTGTPVRLPSRLSWSAISSYSECGERFRLERLYKVERDTWYATEAGSAIHMITEEIDRAAMTGLPLRDALAMAVPFRAKFDQCIAESGATGFRPSGRKLNEVGEQGGPNKRDYDWWLAYGPEFVERYVRWREQRTDWEIAMLPDGRPGIEVQFDIDIEGRRVVGMIDRVFHCPGTGEYILLDIKTGREPGGKLQLAVYDLGLRVTLGIEISWATYWTPRLPRGVESGTPDAIGSLSDFVSASDWDTRHVEAMFTKVERGIRNGVFLPQVTMACQAGCVVAEYCWAVGGRKRKQIPVFDEILDDVTGEVVFSGGMV